jgi:hypothetical protein
MNETWKMPENMIDSKDILRNTNPPSVVFTRDMITDSN